MIEIIKHGKKRKAIYPECECEFTYEKEDIKYYGQREEYEGVKCPDCGRMIPIE